MSSRQQIVIVGAGPAGCAAAVQCKRLGVAPLLLDQTGEAGGLVRNAFSVENYPGLDPTCGPAFVSLLRAHLERFDVTVQRGRVDGIENTSGGFVVSGDFGDTPCGAVIVAVGTRSKTLDLPGATALEGKGFYYDVWHVRKGEGDAVVVGGGEAALDYALTLARSGKKVTILVRGEALRARGRLVDLIRSEPSVLISYRTAPTALVGKGDWVELQATGPDGPLSYSAVGVFAAVGRTPESPGLLKGLDADPEGTVSTRIPGLYVVGDARFGGLGQVGMAVGDGLAAAQAAVRFLG